MLRDPHLTDGIGAKTAHNTPCTSTQDALIDHNSTSATNAKQKKKNKTAQPRELNQVLYESSGKSSRDDFSDFAQPILGLLNITSACGLYEFSKESKGQN